MCRRKQSCGVIAAGLGRARLVGVSIPAAIAGNPCKPEVSRAGVIGCEVRLDAEAQPGDRDLEWVQCSLSVRNSPPFFFTNHRHPPATSMATRRQIHIAVAHHHDNEGCKSCQDRFGESGSGGDSARKAASGSGTSTPPRSDSKRRSSAFESSAVPSHPRFPRSMSDPNAFRIMGTFGDAANFVLRPRSANPRHTFVFSADVQPATSPRTHHHHSASLTPSQLAAHAFGPPAKGYNFGDEGGVKPWPECEQESSSSAAGYAQSEDRKKRRRSKLRYSVSQSADGVNEFRQTSLSSPETSLSSLERPKSESSLLSSSTGDLMDVSPSSSRSRSSLEVTSDDKMEITHAATAHNLNSINEPEASQTSERAATIVSSSSSASTTKKRKRRSFQFRSSYHPLLRSEMHSPPVSCTTTTASTPSLMHSSPNLSIAQTPSIPPFLSSFPPMTQQLLPGYPSDPPLTISELDLFGAGATRELVDWGEPPPASTTDLQRTWRRSERAPLPPRVRRLQQLLQLEQRSLASADRPDPAILANQPALQSSSTHALSSIDVEMGHTL